MAGGAAATRLGPHFPPEAGASRRGSHSPQPRRGRAARLLPLLPPSRSGCHAWPDRSRAARDRPTEADIPELPWALVACRGQTQLVTRRMLAVLISLVSALALGCGRQEPNAHRRPTVKTPRAVPVAAGPGRLVAIGGGRSLYL